MDHVIEDTTKCSKVPWGFSFSPIFDQITLHEVEFQILPSYPVDLDDCKKQVVQERQSRKLHLWSHDGVGQKIL